LESEFLVQKHVIIALCEEQLTSINVQGGVGTVNLLMLVKWSRSVIQDWKSSIKRWNV